MFKKSILVLIVLCFIPIRRAESQPVTSLQPSIPALSLNANNTAAPQTGRLYAIPQSCNTFTWIISFATAPGSVTTLLEFSNDNVTYVTGDTSTATAGESRTVFSSARFIRTTESARSGGSSITTSLVCKNGLIATIVSNSQITSPLTLTTTNEGTTSTSGINLNNITPATLAIPVQYSPRVLFTGNGWDTNDTVSRPVRWLWEVNPTSGTTVSGTATLKYLDPITSAISTPFSVFPTGTINLLGTGGGMNLGTGAFIGSLAVSSGYLYFPADAQFRFDNFASSTGIGLDVSTNGIAAIRSRTFAADAALRGSFYSSSASSVLTITSNVIAPTSSIHHLGAGLVKTITVPTTCTPTCNIDIVPDAAFTTDATGNISLASTAVTNKTLRFTWDGTKWNPSY